MNSLFPRASLKRSPRTRTRKNSTSEVADIVSLSRDPTVSRRKTRPPPLQIIPEMSENNLDISPTNSPATARPARSVTQKSALHTSCITLSAYTFSIDDALFVYGGEAPGSPALSASSSISDDASSEDVPPTPETSDDEDRYDFILPAPRLDPQRISIRPLCITKTQSLVYHEHDDHITNYLGEEEEQYDPLTPIKGMSHLADETEEDFYVREFEGFISFSPVIPFFPSAARRDSPILTEEFTPSRIEFSQLNHRSRSRHSKPLPLLPPSTPPIASFPLVPTFSLVQTAAQKSVVRRERNIRSHLDHLSPDSCPLPRMEVSLNIESGECPDENLETSSRRTTIEQASNAEDASVDSQPPFACARPISACPLPLVVPETPLFAVDRNVTPPRSSTDSDAPRSSIDSTSFVSASSNVSVSPSSFLNSLFCGDGEFEATERLRSRWSSSTLASLAAEQQRSTTLLSPLRNVLGSRPRRVPPQKTPPQTSSHLSSWKYPKNKRGVSTTPPSTPPKHIRQQGSQSSTSSTGTSSSDGERCDRSPSRTKRKPIPMPMFLRAA